MRSRIIIHTLAMAGALLPVLVFPVVPMQDYPDWLYQGYVLRGKILGEAWTDAFSLHSYVAPNIASTLLAGLLSLVFPLAICTRLVLGIVLAVQYFGYNSYFKLQLTSRCPGTAFLAAALCFNYSWWHGNINFVLGVALATWLGSAAVQGRWLESGLWKTVAASLAVYCCHLFGLMIFGAIVMVDALANRRFKSAARFAACLLPAILLFLHYLSSAAPAGAGLYEGMTWSETLGDRLMIIGRYLVPFPAFTGMDESPFLPLWAANAIAAGIFLLAVCLSARHILKNAGGAMLQPLVLAGIMGAGALFAPMWGGGVVALNERFLLFLILNCIVCALAGMARYPRLLTALCLALWLGIVVHAVFFTAAFDGALPGPSAPNPPRRSHLQLHDPFVRMPYYRAIETRQVLDVFPTGMFASPGVGLPPGVQGPLKKPASFPPLHEYFSRLFSRPRD